MLSNIIVRPVDAIYLWLTVTYTRVGTADYKRRKVSPGDAFTPSTVSDVDNDSRLILKTATKLLLNI